MTYDELKKAYELSLEKCSELERKIENKDLEIDNLTEQLLKRNQMLFGKKSERSKHLNVEGQTALDESFLVNEAEEKSDEAAEEPTVEIIEEKAKKSHPHRGRKLHDALPKKKITFRLEDEKCTCPECQAKLRELAAEHITSRIAIIPGKVYMVEYERMKYMCPHCDKNAEKSVVIAAPGNAPASVVPKGLADSSLIADIIQKKYQLGVPLYRQEKHWASQGIYINRTAMANWVIAAGKWFAPLLKQFWKFSFEEPVLNMDETEIKVLNINGKPNGKKCQMWVCATGAKSSRNIAIY